MPVKGERASTRVHGTAEPPEQVSWLCFATDPDFSLLRLILLIVNTFILRIPLSCDFIDYRPGAAATILFIA